MQIESKHCAFVTFTSRLAAETAAEALSNRLIIKGNRCRLLWGKPQQKRDDAAAAAASMLPSQVSTVLPPLANAGATAVQGFDIFSCMISLECMFLHLIMAIATGLMSP